MVGCGISWNKIPGYFLKWSISSYCKGKIVSYNPCNSLNLYIFNAIYFATQIFSYSIIIITCSLSDSFSMVDIVILKCIIVSLSFDGRHSHSLFFFHISLYFTLNTPTFVSSSFCLLISHYQLSSFLCFSTIFYFSIL